MSARSNLSRRQFLKLAGISTAGVLLAACAQAPAAAPTAAPAAKPAEAQPTTAAAQPTAAETKPTAAPAAKDAVTISYWHIWGGARVDQVNAVLKDFTATKPNIKVEPLLLPNPGYADKILTGLAADPPDATMINTAEFAPSAQRGALKQLDDLMKQDGLSADMFYPGAWAMAVWQGKAFGLPSAANFLQMLYWNRDDFKGAGLDPEKGPESWDELMQIATKLTKKEGNKIAHLGYVPSGTGEWRNAAYRNGVNWFGDGTADKVAIDTPQSLEALQFTVDLYKAMGGWDAVGATLTGWGNQQLGNPMIAGVASVITSAVFTVNIINQQKPNLNYKVGKLPKGPKGDFVDVIENSWDNAIPTKSKHPAEAWDLVKYLSAGDGHYKFMVEMQARPAMVKKQNEPPKDAPARKGNPYWDIVLEILNGKEAAYPVSEQLGAATKIMDEAFQSVMLEQRTPKDGAAWAQGEVVKLFKQK